MVARLRILPVHLFESFGQLQAKIPTEVLITDRKEFELADEGFIPLTMRKGSDNAAFFSANSVQNLKNSQIQKKEKPLKQIINWVHNCHICLL